MKFKEIKAMVNMNENIILIANHRNELITYDIEIEIICLLIQNEYNIYIVFLELIVIQLSHAKMIPR